LTKRRLFAERTTTIDEKAFVRGANNDN